MAASAAFAAGSMVVVRDEEWLVSSCERTGTGWKLRCTGSSELVRGVAATFYDALDDVEPLDPAEATLVQDDSPRFRRSRLWVESILRKTPIPLHEPGLTVSQYMLLDTLEYQRKAVATALDANRLRPRLLIADAVGLGKTLEIGMILAELARRGRAERVLVVTPRHVLEQMQYELWTRFSLPLVRLDSEGIQRVRQQLPSSRNPFTYFLKVIVSIDTLKSARYRAHLEKHHWDAVVIDESHNVTNAAAQRSELARLLAGQTDALILASATPHNGDAESFAELVSLLDPTAIVNRERYDVKDIQHLFVRRHRHSPDVAREVGHMWAERPEARGARRCREPGRGRRRERALQRVAASRPRWLPDHRRWPSSVPVDARESLPLLPRRAGRERRGPAEDPGGQGRGPHRRGRGSGAAR